MKRMNGSLCRAAALFALTFLLLGCQGAWIVYPENKLASSSPVTPFVVQFDGSFVPGTFQAWLDGQDITAAFSPPAAAGNQSSAAAPAFEGGEPNPPGYSPGFYQHTLVVVGQRSGDGSSNSDEHKFVPPKFLFSPASLNLVETVAASMEVQLPVPPPAPVQVTLTPSNNAVSINGALPGAPVVVTIPVTDRRAFFTIQPIAPTTISIAGSASGVQRSTVWGTIRRRP